MENGHRRENDRTEVCVIGAGFAGLSVAYLLAIEGRRVIVLDDGLDRDGNGDPPSAQLTHVLATRYDELERLHGSGGAWLAAQSHGAAIDLIQGLVEDEGLDCAFQRVDGYLFVPPHGDTSVLERELAAVRRAGLGDVAWVSRAPIAALDTGRCLRFPRQGQLHAPSYLGGLRRAIARCGGTILAGTNVRAVRSGSPVVIEGKGFSIAADVAVLTTYAPIDEGAPSLLGTAHVDDPHMPTSPGRRRSVIGARVPRGCIERALLWDIADDPGEHGNRYGTRHHVRVGEHPRAEIADGHDLLVIAEERDRSAEVDDDESSHRRLVAWARERFPMIEGIDGAWSTSVDEPIDGLALIGAYEDNIYVATGDRGGNRVTHGAIAGLLLRDLIVGRTHSWEKLYTLHRSAWRMCPTMAGETWDACVGRRSWDLHVPELHAEGLVNEEASEAYADPHLARRM